jgi:hypothetical protein
MGSGGTQESLQNFLGSTGGFFDELYRETSKAPEPTFPSCTTLKTEPLPMKPGDIQLGKN